MLGSAHDDVFSLSLSENWSIDGGGGNDSVSLAANSGAVSEGNLLGVLGNVDEIDFTASNVQGNLNIDASFIQSLVGNGNASHLTVRFDGDDSLEIDPSAHFAQVGNEYTLYSDASLTTEIARVTVA